MAAPTSTMGYVDPYALGNNNFASLYIDLLEHIPDLTFPLSIPVYAKMRRDPKLSSILQGWTLNLRRAQWQLDPAGCRPEVVQLVADSMGLAVKGVDKPGPARLRGVSWGDHLGAALRVIPFGFAAFELEADTSNTRVAQLSGLWERPQWTISHIHTDGKTGLLTGATQDRAAKVDTPQLPAKNLAWYAREREGANWAGTSLLRPSYASWLIKEEVRRAYAVANVRWSAGVPVMEALPGTNPSPAQMAEAAQMAQDARAGIQAGGSTPPGFVMKILGISGSLPNSQEFLRWLDQQCSASALMAAFDLGETPNGSRALGSVFVDALHLALESEAEFVADVATRQVAARIVDWNYGDTEPVPRVVVSGVGSRREVTAESLQLLLSSGALAADPGLEAWVRREYRLPEREAMAQPKVSAPGADLADESPAGKPTGGTDNDTEKVAASVAAAGPGVGHADSCETAGLASVCHCGCNGTRHGEHRSRARLGPVNTEKVQREGRDVRIAGMTDDELMTLFVRLSAEEQWDAFGTIDAEMSRREKDSEWLTSPGGDDHWDTGGEPTEQDHQVNALLAEGYDYLEAFAQVFGKDTDKLRREEKSSAVDRAAGESVDAAVRRGYDQWVYEQWLRAETDTRGHLLTPQAETAGIHPVDLFSGPTSRARKWASEDLQRWWADNPRITFTQYRAQVLGRDRDRKAAQLTSVGGNGRDFL